MSLWEVLCETIEDEPYKKADGSGRQSRSLRGGRIASNLRKRPEFAGMWVLLHQSSWHHDVQAPIDVCAGLGAICQLALKFQAASRPKSLSTKALLSTPRQSVPSGFVLPGLYRNFLPLTGI